MRSQFMISQSSTAESLSGSVLIIYIQNELFQHSLFESRSRSYQLGRTIGPAPYLLVEPSPHHTGIHLFASCPFAPPRL